jgi:hypothetical protein
MMWRRWALVVCLSGLFLFPATGVNAGQRAAYQHLNEVMDRFHRTFDVFTDLGAAGNHFTARCAMVRNPGNPRELADVRFDETWTHNCQAGATCIKNTFVALDPTYWGGWYLQNGVLLAGDTQPRCNWGDVPNAGIELTGTTKITFWARGDHGGEEIAFFVGGVGRDPWSGQPVKPYPDSFPRVPRVGQVTTLTTTWQQYAIDLTGQDLSYVIGGFGWVANAVQNPTGATFYVDDVQYNKARPNALRLLVSYDTLPTPAGSNVDTILKNVAFTYDNVMALLAYLARGSSQDLRRVRLLADALVYAQKHDRFYDDGRLRNAYQGGDLILPPGWRPQGREGTVGLPGWWDPAEQQWREDAEQVGTSTGNMAWTMIGLLRAYQALGKPAYLQAAKRLGTWIEAHARDTRGVGGYTGGYVGWEPHATRLMWKSTEHNLDVYVAYMTLFDLTGKAAWRERALYAQRFVRAMWGACGADHFATGTTDDGVTPNCAFAPEDVNTWALMALGEVQRYGAGIDWVKNNSTVSEACFDAGRSATGIDFNDDRDGIWWEGTSHMVIAQRIQGEDHAADALLTALRQAQRQAPNANGKGLVAACHDGVTTGIPGFALLNRLHVGATAWYAIAEQRYNPFWGIRTDDAIPHAGQ